MSEHKTYIFLRPLYKVYLFIDGEDAELEIQLTAKGRRFARERAQGFHRRIDGEDGDALALAEILSARDNWIFETAQNGAFCGLDG